MSRLARIDEESPLSVGTARDLPMGRKRLPRGLALSGAAVLLFCSAALLTDNGPASLASVSRSLSETSKDIADAKKKKHHELPRPVWLDTPIERILDGGDYGASASTKKDGEGAAIDPAFEIPPVVQEGGTANHAHRQMSVALPDGRCLVTPARVPDPPVVPAYAASFPGSGARMTWNLIEAITGLITGDEHGYNGHGKNVVTVKTHYPQSDGKVLEWDNIIQRGFILLRNPRYALPSLHNFVYEVSNGLPAHSTRAPIEEWRKWRDANFESQLKAWGNFLDYWLGRIEPANRIIVTFEGLTDDVAGPRTAQKLSDFLAREPNVHPVADESIECVWRTVVKYGEDVFARDDEDHDNRPGGERMLRGQLLDGEIVDEEYMRKQTLIWRKKRDLVAEMARKHPRLTPKLSDAARIALQQEMAELRGQDQGRRLTEEHVTHADLLLKKHEELKQKHDWADIMVKRHPHIKPQLSLAAQIALQDELDQLQRERQQEEQGQGRRRLQEGLPTNEAKAQQEPQVELQAQGRVAPATPTFNAEKAMEYARLDQERSKAAFEAAVVSDPNLAAGATGTKDREKGTADNSPAMPMSRRERGTEEKPFTQAQIYSMIRTLEALKEKHKEDEQVGRILTHYVENIWTAKPDAEGEAKEAVAR